MRTRLRSQSEFGAEGGEPTPREPEAARKGIDPAWIAVVVGIPPAVLAAYELNEKLKLIERTQAMLDALRARLGKAAATIRVGAEQRYDLATVKARELVDALIEAAKRATGGGADKDKGE